MNTTVMIASLVLRAWELWDAHTRAEQQRTGKTAAELLTETEAQIDANQTYGEELKKKFGAMEKTPE